MQDVRSAQLETRRIMAISRWPLLMMSTLGQGVMWVAIWAGEASDPVLSFTVGIFLSALLFAVLICGKKINRAGVGANAPLALSPGSSRPRDRKMKLIWVLALAAGLGLGIAMPIVGRTTHGYSIITYGMVAFLGLIVALTVYSWIRTMLWEYGFMALVLILVPVSLRFISIEIWSASGVFLLLMFGTLLSLVLGASFFLRWRRWMRSLPQNVKSEEE